jgi:dynein heavy chain
MKINLANGESISMSKETTLMFETDNLINTTPATISRCGLVYMQQESIIKPKMLLLSWIRTLPNNLIDYKEDILNYCSYLLYEAL